MENSKKFPFLLVPIPGEVCTVSVLCGRRYKMMEWCVALFSSCVFLLANNNNNRNNNSHNNNNICFAQLYVATTIYMYNMQGNVCKL